MTLLRKAAERYARETGTPLTVVGAAPGCTADHNRQPPHPCPYKADVKGDSKTLCVCCAACTRECARDI